MSWSRNAHGVCYKLEQHVAQFFIVQIIVMSNLILSKESSESEIKAYFNAVLKLSQSDNAFPINLDEVWMLVYSSRSKSVRALKDNFIENEDYLPVSQNGQRSDGGRFSNGNQTDYFLSLSCMEFFIARKVRPVFEVYRQVFHKTVRNQLSPIEMQLEMMKSMQLQLQELIETRKKYNKFLFGSLRNCCTFAVLTVRQTLLLRRAAVNCSMVVGLFYAQY